MSEKIRIRADADLVAIVQHAYDLSKPQGMGYMHFVEGPLPLEEAKEYVRMNGEIAISLDYIRGRACKLVVFRDEDGLWMRGDWFDHSDEALQELVRRIDRGPND